MFLQNTNHIIITIAFIVKILISTSNKVANPIWRWAV